jgi:hypothetical protein
MGATVDWATVWEWLAGIAFVVACGVPIAIALWRAWRGPWDRRRPRSSVGWASWCCAARRALGLLVGKLERYFSRPSACRRRSTR